MLQLQLRTGKSGEVLLVCHRLMILLLVIQSCKQIAAAKLSSSCDNKNQTNCALPPSAGQTPTSLAPTRALQAKQISSNTTQRPDLITRTTGAIYNALSSVFSFAGSEEEKTQPEATTTVYNSTRQYTTRSPKLITSTSSTIASSAMANRSQKVSTAVDLKAQRSNLTQIQIGTTLKPSPPRPATTKSPRVPSLQPVQIQQAKFDSNRTPQISQNNSSNTKDGQSQANRNSSSPLNGPRLYNMLGSALETIYSLRSALNYLNRTTRLAPEHGVDEILAVQNQDAYPPKQDLSKPGKLVLRDDHLIANHLGQDDVHLLCKLLHKHLQSNGTGQLGANPLSELSETSTKTKPNEIATITTLSPLGRSTISPKLSSTTGRATTTNRKVISTGDALQNLNSDLHSRYLLESVFSYNKSDFNYRDERVVLNTAERLLGILYNESSRISRGMVYTSSEPDYDSESTTPSVSESADEVSMLVGSSNSSNPLIDNTLYLVKSWRKGSRVSPDQIQLVYWLIIRRNILSRKNSTEPALTESGQDSSDEKVQFELVGADDANKLLDELRDSMTPHLERLRLKFVGVLVANYSQKSSGHRSEPHIIDDSQTETADGGERAPKSGLQLLFDRFSDSSFVDHLLLYLIIFIVILFAIILCFAIPMFCCRPSTTNELLTQQAVKRRRRKQPNQAIAAQQGQSTDLPPVSIIGHGEGQAKRDLSMKGRDTIERDERVVQLSDSIWRKLSSSTTTLVKDQSEVVRSDGTVNVPVMRESPTGVSNGQPKRSQFGWYSFEDRLEEEERRSEVANTCDRQSQTYIMSSDRRRITKSVQTERANSRDELDTPQSHELDLRDRLERKSTDTLTKSELVMMKEKLVPIAQQHQQHTRQVASQTSDPSEPFYVNQSATTADARLNGKQQQVQSGQSESIEDNRLDSWRRPVSSFGISRPISSEPSRFIDSSESKPNSLSESVQRVTDEQVVGRHLVEPLERVPKMRHLELPPRARSKVDAIKAELSKLEQRDQRMPARSSHGKTQDHGETTYKRFDVI